MGKIFSVLLGFLLFGGSAAAQNYTISGYITDSESGEVLIGANLYNTKKENGTATNSYGFFSYTAPKDTVDFIISYVGYSSKRITFFLEENTTLNIDLNPGNELAEIEVRPVEGIDEVTQMSRINLTAEQIKTVPVLLGEVDVLKALQMVPGVQSGAEGTSGLYVRGGGPDQNLILMDGVPVYNASHLFGFFSVFNADAINNIDLVKGGFPARYGGRLSSVIDITLKEGNKERIKGEGAIGIISSKITIDGPLSDKTSFLLSGRRTYLDLLARPFIKAQSNGDEVAGYYFYDLNAKINHRISDNDRIYLSGYFGKDKAYSISEDSRNEGATGYYWKDELGLKWGNATTAFRWNHIYSPRLFGNITLTYSRYLFDVFDNSLDEITSSGIKNTEEYNSRYYSGIDDFAAKADFNYSPSPKHHIRFGGSAIRHSFNPGALAYSSSYDPDTTLGSQKTTAGEYFLYAEDDFELTEKAKINLGYHASAFNVENNLYYSFEPRAAINYRLPNRLSIKGSYTRMTQYIHLLTNSGIGLPTDLWVPSTAKISPQNASQFTVGIAKVYNELELTLEAYYKKMSNLIEYREGATYLNIESDWQDKITSGTGESYGAEIFLQRKSGKWNGWLGYTLSWNYRQFDEVNFGKKYAYTYDRRHDVSIMASYTPRKGVSYSASWVYGTGNAISLPSSSYLSISNDIYWFEGIDYFNGRNGYRMAAYHRLDISANWTKPKKWGERTWSLGFYNFYNRKNPFFIDIGYDSSSKQNKFVQYSLFPIIPSITYSFKF